MGVYCFTPSEAIDEGATRVTRARNAFMEAAGEGEAYAVYGSMVLNTLVEALQGIPRDATRESIKEWEPDPEFWARLAQYTHPLRTGTDDLSIKTAA